MSTTEKVPVFCACPQFGALLHSLCYNNKALSRHTVCLNQHPTSAAEIPKRTSWGQLSILINVPEMPRNW